MGILRRKKLAFEKIELSRSKITSDKTVTIIVNVKNFEETFDNLVLNIRTDDTNNQYLKVSPISLKLPSLDFTNKNTGDHEITISPFNIPLDKMSFKITVEVYSNDDEKPVLKKEFNLIVNKKQK